MIEESMLAANVCAASFMNKHYKYGVYRVHEKPDDIKLDSLKSFFSLKGFSDGFKKEPLDLITQCLKYSSKKGLSKILQTVVLQSLKRAEYSTKEIGHFGLQLDRYSHFTSPIRRYVDIINHKNMINFLENKPINSTNNIDLINKFQKNLRKFYNYNKNIQIYRIN